MSESLEQKLQSWKNPVEMMRNAPTGPVIGERRSSVTRATRR